MSHQKISRQAPLLVFFIIYVMFDMYCIERIKTLLYYYYDYYYYYYYYMYYERKKSNCNLLFMSALTNYLGTEVGILNTFTIHALVPRDWVRLFFEPCAIACVSCLLPSSQIRERDVCIVPLLILCSCVHLHIFLFYSDT